MLLTHIDRNISSLNSLVDHTDELYALDLAEKNNDLSAVMTLGLTAVSFILTLIMLPSFWTDIQQVDFGNSPFSRLFDVILIMVDVLGTALAVALIGVSIYIFNYSRKHITQIWKVMKRALNRMGR